MFQIKHLSRVYVHPAGLLLYPSSNQKAKVGQWKVIWSEQNISIIPQPPTVCVCIHITAWTTLNWGDHGCTRQECICMCVSYPGWPKQVWCGIMWGDLFGYLGQSFRTVACWLMHKHILTTHLHHNLTFLPCALCFVPYLSFSISLYLSLSYCFLTCTTTLHLPGHTMKRRMREHKCLSILYLLSVKASRWLTEPTFK